MFKTLKKAIPLTLCISLLTAMPTMAYDKEETVYTKIDGEGKVTYQVVNEKLSSSTKEVIEDYSNLSDISNTSGKEKMTKEGKNIEWSSKGNDITYQGKTTKSLPVTTSTTYELNGQKVTPSKVKGQKGHVKLTFNYTNNEMHSYKGSTIYTPFLVVLTTTFNTEKNKNITINTGKIVSNGSSELVMGIASPGLYDSFNRNSKLEELDRIVIEYDTTGFDLNSIYSIASPTNLDEDEIGNTLDEMTDKFNNVSEMKKASNQLVEGSQQLSSGLIKAQDGTTALAKGSKTLSEGSSSLNKGAQSAQSGISQLTKGSNQLASNNKALNDGYAQINSGIQEINQITKKLNKQLTELEKEVSTGQLSDEHLVALSKQITKVQNSTFEQIALKASPAISASLASKAQELTKASQNSAAILAQRQKALAEKSATLVSQSTKVTSDAQAVAKKVQEIGALNPEDEDYQTKLMKAQSELNTLKSQLKTDTAAVNKTSQEINQLKASMQEAQEELTSAKNKLEAIKSEMNKDSQLSASFIKKVYEADKKANLFGKCGSSYKASVDTTGYSEINAGIYPYLYQLYMATDSAAESLNALIASYKTLDKETKTLIDTKLKEINTQTESINTLAKGSKEFQEKLKQYTDGVQTLQTGLNTLNDSFNGLVSGTKQINDGAQQLSQATDQLNTGMAQLVSGSKTLADGMKQFKKQAVDQIVDLVDTLKDDKDKLDTLKKYAEDYKYTETNKEANYSTKFITVIEN